MTRFASSGLLALLAVILVAGAPGALAATPGDAINANCPISGQPINGATFAEHDGKTIGFCCGGCRGKFVAWTDERKGSFVAQVLAKGAGAAAGDSADGPTTRPGAKGDLYTLDTCPVSGGKLGSMGDPVVKVYDGREVRFCCGGCIEKFEADRARFFKSIDEKIVLQQRPIYPLDTCVITGEPLVENGEDVGVDVIVGNRLVRVCCRRCARKITKDPAPFLAKLDAAIIAKQRAAYPLDTCLVAGEKLDAAGKPVEMVAGNRLVLFCCKGCIKEFRAEPARYLAALDNAWRKHEPGPRRAAEIFHRG